MGNHIVLARAGEDAAARLYERLGYAVIARNWSCPHGEIDVIAASADTVVFCEVKTRRSRYWGEPSEAVDLRKQARLRRLAGCWLAGGSGRGRAVRFDVVSIVVRDGRAHVEHIPEAF
jgi:putative endonuclease